MSLYAIEISVHGGLIYRHPSSLLSYMSLLFLVHIIRILEEKKAEKACSGVWWLLLPVSFCSSLSLFFCSINFF